MKSKDEKPPSFFELGDNTYVQRWRDEWKGMPEFVQRNLKPWKQLIINFSCEEDMDQFASLVEQRITPTTQSIWYPIQKAIDASKMRYIDEP